ncbi:hypothetical protein [Rhodoferax sp. WC2427]|uniref:hypothetical protein n=1 Tax=Rhodoferax sp. WC2427 TaxID=3234144 RepID=UPI0034674162
MNGLRKPRQVRWTKCADTISTAILGATKLTATERASVLEPLQDAHKALREGVATQWQWTQFASAMEVAQAIEQRGVVRGLKAHLYAAELALQAIERRAMRCKTWQAVPLDLEELDTLAIAINLHEFQLTQLGASEFHAAVKTALGHITSSAGQVLSIKPPSIESRSHAAS